MDAVRHGLDRGSVLRMPEPEPEPEPELTYSHAVPSSDHRWFRAFAVQDISPSPLGTSHHRGPRVVELAQKWCDHRDRGCPHDCDSKKSLCDRCERNECSAFHG
ncbi:hypothetical protein F4815DRAFT_132657 [Daldinia loculata]|uniref:uncharacterized protein n=1 Tax=Daldinia loculata TaxID=103429 RepID=UPI0020C4DAE2|nr:uncharacterized protein F4817DRAFT_329889 [Daldinia loculata]KAI1649718.1 hypothetical protein F4817DRAFT_329889 [Daldinia loculata]KAI2784692.1 hypothetical protein F4815DRAFT_132657 [Daldinia loculata]